MTPSEKHLEQLFQKLDYLYEKFIEASIEKEENRIKEQIKTLLRDNLKPKSDYLEEPQINELKIGI